MFLSFLLCQCSTVVGVNPSSIDPAGYYLKRIDRFDWVESFDTWDKSSDHLDRSRAEKRVHFAAESKKKTVDAFVGEEYNNICSYADKLPADLKAHVMDFAIWLSQNRVGASVPDHLFNPSSYAAMQSNQGSVWNLFNVWRSYKNKSNVESHPFLAITTKDKLAAQVYDDVRVLMLLVQVDSSFIKQEDLKVRYYLELMKYELERNPITATMRTLRRWYQQNWGDFRIYDSYKDLERIIFYPGVDSTLRVIKRASIVGAIGLAALLAHFKPDPAIRNSLEAITEVLPIKPTLLEERVSRGFKAMGALTSETPTPPPISMTDLQRYLDMIINPWKMTDTNACNVWEEIFPGVREQEDPGTVCTIGFGSTVAGTPPVVTSPWSCKPFIKNLGSPSNTANRRQQCSSAVLVPYNASDETNVDLGALNLGFIRVKYDEMGAMFIDHSSFTTPPQPVTTPVPPTTMMIPTTPAATPMPTTNQPTTLLVPTTQKPTTTPAPTTEKPTTTLPPETTPEPTVRAGAKGLCWTNYEYNNVWCGDFDSNGNITNARAVLDTPFSPQGIVKVRDKFLLGSTNVYSTSINSITGNFTALQKIQTASAAFYGLAVADNQLIIASVQPYVIPINLENFTSVGNFKPLPGAPVLNSNTVAFDEVSSNIYISYSLYVVYKGYFNGTAVVNATRMSIPGITLIIYGLALDPIAEKIYVRTALSRIYVADMNFTTGNVTNVRILFQGLPFLSNGGSLCVV